MKIRLSLKKCALWFMGIIIVCGLMGSAAVVMLFYWASRDLPDLNRIAEYKQPQATVILARDGSMLGTLNHEKRFVIGLKDMSRYLPMSFLAAEDDAFYRHMGIDPVAIMRAAINNFRKGRQGEGGSTITQQLIKQLLLTSERSYTRKMKEAILAYQLEKNFTKDQILTIYLNQIYLGEHSYGVESAARTYFGKHASDITLAESAVIAGLPKAPSTYNPFRRPEEAKNRQMYVLGRLRDLKWITQAEYDQAAAEPLVYWSMPEGVGGPAQWYLEEARRLLVEFFTESNLRALGIETNKSGADYVYEAGLTVRTAMDPAHQNAAGAALRRGLEELDKRQGWRGPIEQLDAAKQKEFLAKTAFSPIDLAGGEWVKALVTAVDAREVKVALGQGYTGIVPVAAMSWARKPNPKVAAANAPAIKDPKQVAVPGDVICVSAEDTVITETSAKGKKEQKTVPFDASSVKKNVPITLRLQQEPLVELDAHIIRLARTWIWKPFFRPR